MTQSEKIIRYCNRHGSITSYQAYADLGITQLGARIKELEERGIFFEREWEKSVNRDGEPVQFKKYSIKKDEKGS